jgi:hypothetical protein
MSHLSEAQSVAEHFRIPKPFRVGLYENNGNINDTFMVTCADGHRYLLQHVNTTVFPMPERVMAGMEASILAQHRALASRNGSRWKPLELVETESGGDVWTEHGPWRMLRYIERTVACKSLSELPPGDRNRFAREAGRGLAIYSDLTSGIDVSSLKSSLPGYRDTRLYYSIFDSIVRGTRDLSDVDLPTDEAVRTATSHLFVVALPHDEWERRMGEMQDFISMANENRELAMTLQNALESGEIRTTAIHGDPKVENFLFDATSGEVVSLVDLDTVMPHTWLLDYGDMVRSFVNVVGEKERDLSRVAVDGEIYDAVRNGFLSETTTATPREKELMDVSVQVMTLELAVRFLTDYLRGDTYFRPGSNDPADINKVRALVQFELFSKLAG